MIFSQGAEPVEHLRVVRSGAVEIVLDGRVLDRLESGELFGHASMLSGLPPGFAARAVEDTLCYRIPADVAREVLSRPEGHALRRALTARAPGGGRRRHRARPRGRRRRTSRSAALIRGAPVVVRARDPDPRCRARRCRAAGASAVVVDLGDGSLGIVTDHDLRTRVVAGGRLRRGARLGR